MSATLTRITSRKPSTLSKRYWIGEDGTLCKDTVAHMLEGGAERVSVSSPSEFAAVLTNLTHDQALVYGVPAFAVARILSKTEYEKRGRPADAITRTKDNFRWPDGAGIFMLDYDPNGERALSKTELLAQLRRVLPNLDTLAFVWWPSASSLIFHEHEQLQGIRGQRVYLFAQNASDIERAGKVFFDRLWLAGLGRYQVSRSGALLERSLIDSAVWQTNRLDFAAGAQCVAPLEQRRGAPESHDGDTLDTAAALPDLTEAEQAQLKAIKDKAKDDIAPEQQAIQAAYIDDEAEKLVRRSGKEITDENIEQARATIQRAVAHQILAGDFQIVLADGTTRTVGEILDKPTEYHGQQTRDPLEPEYAGGRVVGKLFLIGGRPNLHSFAHGGRTFRLIRQPRRIEHIDGTMADTTRQTLDFVRELPEFFDLGSELVRVGDGAAERMTRDLLAFHLGGVAQFWCWKRTPGGNLYEKLLDPPPAVLNQILALGTGRSLRPLKAVITAPVITESGRVLSCIGYDRETELYLDALEHPPAVPALVTTDQAIQAAGVLLEPFRDFCAATALDTGVLLSAALTAIQRPVLPTAPAIGIDAPVQGTGKTYLAQCLGTLATGEPPRVYPHTAGRDDEETRKRLTAVLAAGERVLVWDNVLGHFDSAALAAFLTSHEFADRVLGKSETVVFPNRVFVLLTGNNLALAGDMPRRVLTCRLDARIENPATRQFKQNPLRIIERDRPALVSAALTFIRGYLQNRPAGFETDTTASFETWDSLCRQPVAWLAKQCPNRFEDPANAIRNAINSDPERDMLGNLLAGIEDVMGQRWFTANELLHEFNGLGGITGIRAELHDALLELTSHRGRLTGSGLGRILAYRIGRIAGGRYLECVRVSGRIRYRVQRHETRINAAA